MQQEWRVPFSDGSLWASDPEGEPLAGGEWLAGNDPIRAYLALEDMFGVRTREMIASPDRITVIWGFIQIRRRTLYFDWIFDILGNARYLPPPVSNHPAPPAQQVQVYEGTFRAMWRQATLIEVVSFV